MSGASPAVSAWGWPSRGPATSPGSTCGPTWATPTWRSWPSPAGPGRGGAEGPPGGPRPGRVRLYTTTGPSWRIPAWTPSPSARPLSCTARRRWPEPGRQAPPDREAGRHGPRDLERDGRRRRARPACAPSSASSCAGTRWSWPSKGMLAEGLLRPPVLRSDRLLAQPVQVAYPGAPGSALARHHRRDARRGLPCHGPGPLPADGRRDGGQRPAAGHRGGARLPGQHRSPWSASRMAGQATSRPAPSRGCRTSSTSTSSGRTGPSATTASTPQAARRDWTSWDPHRHAEQRPGPPPLPGRDRPLRRLHPRRRRVPRQPADAVNTHEACFAADGSAARGGGAIALPLGPAALAELRSA